MLKQIDIVDIAWHISKFIYSFVPCNLSLELFTKITIKRCGFYELPIVLACIFSNNNAPTIYDTDQLHELSRIFMKVMPKVYSGRAYASWTRDKFKWFFNSSSFKESNEESMKLHLGLASVMADLSWLKILASAFKGTKVFDFETIKKALNTSFVHKYAIDTMNNLAEYCQNLKKLTKSGEFDMIES